MACMKTTNWILSILVAALVIGTGCSEGRKEAPATVIGGVEVDLAKFQQAFMSAPAEVQTSVSRVHMAIRYGQYAQAVAQMEKLANASGLTEPQKNVAREVLSQLKQAASRSPTRQPQ